MDEGLSRREATSAYRRARAVEPSARRPDRLALWAFALCLLAMVAAAATAQGAGGGTGTSTSGTCKDANFGARSLALGDCGNDVKTLNWLLKADEYGVPLEKDFDNPTDDSVRRFQRRHDLSANGVVRSKTRRKVVRTMNKSVATWYGPGFYGRKTACGKTLHRDTVGVAHRHLPCGTKVTFGYKGHYVRARVIDRGPYANGARWDLTGRLAKKLHFTTTDTVKAAPIR
jgi:Putative peptidoglycan binding domain/Lytic transglycolase